MVSDCVKVASFCLPCDCGIPVFPADLAAVAAAASDEGFAVGLITALTRSESVTGSTLSGRAASGSIGEFKDISLLANVGRITMSGIHEETCVPRISCDSHVSCESHAIVRMFRMARKFRMTRKFRIANRRLNVMRRADGDGND